MKPRSSADDQGFPAGNMDALSKNESLRFTPSGLRALTKPRPARTTTPRSCVAAIVYLARGSRKDGEACLSDSSGCRIRSKIARDGDIDAQGRLGRHSPKGDENGRAEPWPRLRGQTDVNTNSGSVVGAPVGDPPRSSTVTASASPGAKPGAITAAAPSAPTRITPSEMGRSLRTIHSS